MPRGLVLIVCIALGLGLGACGDDGNNESARASECHGPADAFVKDIGDASDFEPVKSGTLSVVTSLPGPGFWEGSDTDPAEVTSGYEYDIAEALQDAFGLDNLVLRNESFGDIVAGTVEDYDVALSQISITCERAQVADFTMPYFESNQGVLVKADSGINVTTLDEAKKILWGVREATTAAGLLDQFVEPDKSPAVYDELPDAYDALRAGEIDAVLIDTSINLGEAARSNGKLKVVAEFEQPGGPDQYGALLPKGSRNTPAVNAVLEQLKQSGDLDRFAKENLTTVPGDLPVIEVS